MTNIRDKFANIPDDARISILWSDKAAEFVCDAKEIKEAMGKSISWQERFGHIAKAKFIAESSPQEVEGRDVGSVVVETVDESPVDDDIQPLTGEAGREARRRFAELYPLKPDTLTNFEDEG